MTDSEDGPGSEVELARGELVVARQGGLLVLQGPKAVIEQLTAMEPVLRDHPSPALKSAGVIGSLASLKDLLPSTGTHQQVFKLDAQGLKQLKLGQLKQATDGRVNMVARGADGRFLKQGRLIPVDVNPADALNAQMALMTLALSAAIDDVAEAVARVEDKVDRLADLLDAARVGAIVGAHRSLARRAQLAGADGSLADADWHAIDDVGIQVEQQIESLRSFVRKRLVSAEGRGDDIADRRDALDDVEELSEALGLVVVAQDSLFLFQQLRLARIRDTEPDRLPSALDEARTLLAAHETADVDLLAQVRQVVAGRATVKALEIHHFITTGSLVDKAGDVDQMLARFAHQRTMSYERIAEVEVPGIDDAVNELRTRGSAVASGGRRIAGGLVNRVRSRGDQAPALPPGTEERALPESTDPGDESAEVEPGSAVTDRLRSRLTKAGRLSLGRLRRRSADGDEHDDEADHDATDV